MKHAYQRLLGLCLLFIAVLLSGCNWMAATDNGNGKHKTLVFNLGNKATLQMVWIEPLNLFVGKYEVSNWQFRRFDPKHTSGQYKQRDLDGSNQPVVNVSWNEAQNFCKWLSTNHCILGGKRYAFRLPTEKEWEAFAACGQNAEYPWGPSWPPPRNWNYFGRENKEPGQKLDNNDGFRVSCPVQRSGPNSWGLFGVGGNVWEWCEDNDGKSQAKVFKGASWSDCHPYFLKLSRRSSNAPDKRFMNRGFRVVASISDVGVEEQKRLEVGER